MKTRSNIYTILIATLFAFGCKKQAFVDANLSPSTLYEVKPEDQFLAAASGSQDDFEYYYDVYRALNLWLQYATNGGASGNAMNFTNPTANFNYRYAKVFYDRVGTRLADGIRTIDQMDDEEEAKYVHQKAILQIFKAYYAFYVSDINGSMPYTEAFQGRYGGTLTPKYNTQQELFNTLDGEIKNAVGALKTAQAVTQTMLGTNDPFFGSSSNQVTAWTKAGNALRLKIGMRLMKRDLAKLTTIANEVIADPVQMSHIDDSWALYTGASYADANGNWNPAGFLASKPIVDFMLTKADPRLRMFYRPNVAAGIYVGSFPSPDESRLPANQPLYATPGGISELQHRIFAPGFNEGNGVGTGQGFYPFLTYAEYCFLRADLIARNIVTGGGTAKEWYDKGVTASIEYYNKRAVAAQVENFTPVTAGEITTYLVAPGVAFDPAKATEQIAVQAYLDFFRQPSEAWAWWKRTGFPNTTSVLPWANLTSNGSVLKLARRASIAILPSTNLNYQNQQEALA
ncbi:MAG TPA: SusD/RagB family nutrient-binding outer membrane lipoprotein, partial [Chitinophagaceae bacterium]|nr:SusD/RagB family nutrient-binding outer membrane lipoprotein [Chitinophagaceae bacterium]